MKKLFLILLFGSSALFAREAEKYVSLTTYVPDFLPSMGVGVRVYPKEWWGIDVNSNIGKYPYGYFFNLECKDLLFWKDYYAGAGIKLMQVNYKKNDYKEILVSFSPVVCLGIDKPGYFQQLNMMFANYTFDYGYTDKPVFTYQIGLKF